MCIKFIIKLFNILQDSPYLMGSKNSRSLPNYDVNYLQMLSPLPQGYVQSQEQPSILKHPQQQSLRSYFILLNSDDIPYCINSLRFRKLHPQQLIQIKYGQVITHEKQYMKIRVYLELIPLNLQQVINLHFLDAMAIFYQAFKAFKILYAEYGSFAPHPRMIVFNEYGQVKTWANVKYSKAKPIVSYQMFDEQKMVEALMQIFSSKVDISTMPINSQNRKFHFKAKTFEQAIQLIQSQVTSPQLLPKSIKSIQNLSKSNRKITENDIISMNSLGNQVCLRSQDKTIKFNYRNPFNKQSNNKSRVSFSFAGQPSNKSSSSVGKINSTSKSKPLVNFTTSSPGNNNSVTEAWASSPQNSRLTTKVNFNVTNSTLQNTPTSSSIEYGHLTTTKRDGRSTSLIKFTYN